jgi:hypothetical protein
MSDGRDEVHDPAWKCPSCGNILGYIGNNGTVLRVKYKDVFLFIEEARSVKTMCRRCGRECTLRQVE